MKFITMCTLLVLLTFICENCVAAGGGGSVAVNVGAYITLYKARKKAREEALRQKSGNKVKPTRRRYHCAPFDFWCPNREYY